MRKLGPAAAGNPPCDISCFGIHKFFARPRASRFIGRIFERPTCSIYLPFEGRVPKIYLPFEGRVGWGFTGLHKRTTMKPLRHFVTPSRAASGILPPHSLTARACICPRSSRAARTAGVRCAMKCLARPSKGRYKRNIGTSKAARCPCIKIPPCAARTAPIVNIKKFRNIALKNTGNAISKNAAMLHTASKAMQYRSCFKKTPQIPHSERRKCSCKYGYQMI